MDNDIYKFYAVIIALVEIMFMSSSIKNYNDEKYSVYYRLFGLLSVIVTFIGIIFCLIMAR